MAQSSKPNIRESIEQAQAQRRAGPRLRTTGLLRAAVWCSYPATGLLVAYLIFRWLFLGGYFMHNSYWRSLALADYVLAVVLSFSAALWLAYLLLTWLQRRNRRRKATSADDE